MKTLKVYQAKPYVFHRIWYLPAILVLAGCLRLVSYYDAVSYKNLTDLKGEMKVFFERAAEEGAGGEADLETLKKFRVEISRAFEYEKGKKLNDNTIEQFRILDKTVSEVLERYAKRQLTPKGECRDIEGGATINPENGCLTAAYSSAKWKILESAFDLAIETERSKLKKKN